MIKIDSNVKDGTLKASVIVHGEGQVILKELVTVTLNVLKDMAAQKGTRLMTVITMFLGRFVNETALALLDEAAEAIDEEEKSHDDPGNPEE